MAILESHICFQLPRSEGFTVSAAASVVLKQSLLDVLGAANVQTLRVMNASEDVDVMHIRFVLLRPYSVLEEDNLLRSPTAKADGAKEKGEPVDAVRTASDEAWSVFLREFKLWCASDGCFGGCRRNAYKICSASPQVLSPCGFAATSPSPLLRIGRRELAPKPHRESGWGEGEGSVSRRF